MAIEEAVSAGVVRRLLAAALTRRSALGLPSRDTSAYRLVHGAGDGLPGLTVDVYGRFLVASLYTEEHSAREQTWLSELGALGFDGVYLKQRPRQANRLDEAERRERAPELPICGGEAPSPLLVHEHGVPYEARLNDGLSTGLFLDQRDNRARFAGAAHNKRVLNLFAYTCAFGVVAARAGALSTSNLDVSKAALERGKRNYALAGASTGADRFLARDVLEALPKLHRRAEQFDLIALDPPSYASTPSGRFRVERDYDKLLALALVLLAPGGSLLACSNHARMSEIDLRSAIEAGAKSVGRRTRELQFVAPPADHPTAPGRPPHLKSAWISV